MKMLQNSNMYYDGRNGSIDTTGIDATNNTPFSVKDILNLADQNNGYSGYHMDG